MSGFSIDFSSGRQWAASMKQAPAIVREEFLRSTDKLTLQGEAFAKGNAPVRTGHLRRSIAAKPAVWAGGAVGTFGTATPYARPVEFGRRGFSARPGHFLRFTVGGRVIYRKSVGPAAPRPFIRPAAARLRPLVKLEYQAAMRRVIDRIGAGT